MQRVHPGAGEAAQVAHAGAARVREGEVGAAMRGRDRLVRDREVADVELVDGRVLGLGERRLGEPVPASRRERARAQVDQDGAPGVRGQRQRVRVGHHVGHDLVERRHVDLHLVGVGRVAPGAAALRAPDAVVAAPHRDAALEPVERDQQADVLRGRRPHGEPGPAPAEGRAEPRVGGIGVELVEHAGDLHPGRPHERALGVVGGHHELAGEQLAGAPAGGAVDPQRLVGGQVRVLLAHPRGQPRGVELERERRAAGDRPVLGGQPAVRRPVQPVAEPVAIVGQVPRDHARAQPVRPALGADRPRQVVGDHVRGVVIGEGDRARRAR